MQLVALFIQYTLIMVIVLTPVILMRLRDELKIGFIISEYFFFPSNGGHSLMGGLLTLGGMPYFTILQGAQIIGLLVVLGNRWFRGNDKRVNQTEKTLFVLFTSLLVLQFLVQLYTSRVFTIVPTNHFLMNYIDVIAALLFAMACAALIHTREQIEVLFKIILFCGLVLSAEMLITYFVPPIKHSLGRWSILYNGKFRSLFLGDAVAVPLWSALTAILCVYFYKIRQQSLYLFYFAICLLPALLDFTRSVLIGLGCAAYLWIYLCQQNRWLKQAMLGLALVLIASLFSSATVLNEALLDQQEQAAISQLSPTEYDHYRQEKQTTYHYFLRRVQHLNALNSSLIRAGQTLRGWQVMEDRLPLGLGPNFLRYYMASDQIPTWNEASLAALATYSPDLRKGYDRVAVQHVQTEAQVGYLDFMFSFGIAGLVLEIFLIGLILLNMKRLFQQLSPYSAGFYLALTVSCMLAIYGVFFMFNATPTLYVILLLLLHATFVLCYQEQNQRA